jgi:hypothetical protein
MSNYSAGNEYVRHISTLSAGAIALQVGFLEKVFPHPQWKPLIAVSIISFTISIGSALRVHWFILESKVGGLTVEAVIQGGRFVRLMSWSFGIGLIVAVVFSLRNLFAL